MPTEEAMYTTPVSKLAELRPHMFFGKAQWESVVDDEDHFRTPSTPSSPASSSRLTLDNDEDGEWSDPLWSDSDALSLAADLESECATFTAERKAISHSSWLQQFAEQARSAHIRNASRAHPISFNPNASPFVPAAVRADAMVAAAPLEKYDLPCLLQVKQPWLSSCRRGSVTADPKSRQLHAENVVASGPWDEDTLAELVDKLINRVSDGCEAELAQVAPFARDVYECLSIHVGEAEAEQFGELLRDRALAEFAVWWDLDLPTSVATLRYEPHAYAPRFLDTAFAVAVFIGDLQAQQFVPPDVVHNCLATLVAKLHVIEQVQAIHAIITHSNASLYDGRTLLILVGVLNYQAAKMLRGTSILGRPFSASDVHFYVQEVSNTVDSWLSAGPSSTPFFDGVQSSKMEHSFSSHSSLDDVEFVGGLSAGPTSLTYSDAVKKRKM